jgi:hypothetical protein
MLNAKYWVRTHDEVKIGGGLIAPFLWRKAYSVLDALGKERREEGSSADMQTSKDLSARISSTGLHPFLEFGVRLGMYDVCLDPTSCIE